MAHMQDNNYNGFFNRATWNVVLWIENDEAAHYFFRDLYHQFSENHGQHGDSRSDMVRCTAHEWFGSTTPDGDRLDDVLWTEVREVLDESYSDILDELFAELA